MFDDLVDLQHGDDVRTPRRARVHFEAVRQPGSREAEKVTLAGPGEAGNYGGPMRPRDVVAIRSKLAGDLEAVPQFRDKFPGGSFDILRAGVGGSLYLVRDEMAAVVGAASCSLPAFELSSYDVSGPGFCAFESPQMIEVAKSVFSAVVSAVSWTPGANGVGVTLWSRPADDPDFEGHSASEFPTLIPVHSGLFTYGETWEANDIPGAQHWAAVVVTLWRMLGETWVDVSRQKVKQRKGKGPRSTEPTTVRVVMLRKAGSETGEGTQQNSPYSHRFLVRGHWRRQFYPSQGRHAPKWIPAFVKGPESAPFVTKTTVHVLAR